jgi:Ca2+-binding RTX toxin-like protein
MDELFFDYPEPLTDGGIASNGSDSDYNFTNRPPGIRVFNDSKPDGDSILLLELKPNAAGVFGSGFAQDFYSFKESAALKEKDASDQPGLVDSPEFTYVAPLKAAAGSNIRSAVVLIQDNEREAAGLLRRTTLGSGNDTREFLFDNKDDTVLAGAGNDIIRSGGGNDILFGEAGDDELDGGAGNDYLFGNQGNDRLFGREGNDWLDGGFGNDRLEGGNGNDTYVVDSFGDQIIDMAGTGMETVRASVNWTLQAGLDHLFLTGNARTGIGNSFNNFMRGNNLGNTIEGGDGNDIIFGDELESKLFGNSFKKFVAYEDFFQTQAQFPGDPTPNLSTLAGYEQLVQIFYPGFGTLPGGDNDTLKGGNGDDKLFGWAGNDQLFGDAGNDWLFGGYGNDELFGGDGNDRLDGEQGADRLIGANGNDFYVIDNLNDVIVDSPQTGIETVESFISFDLRQYSMAAASPIVGATGLDNLTLRGAENLLAWGNNLPNVLIGNSGNNTIESREGDDTLIMSEGNDTLIGGLGADKFRFQALPKATSNAIVQDFNVGQDVIEIAKSAFGNPTLSQFSFSPFGINRGDLFFGSQRIATIQSNAPFSINQNVRLI